MKSQWLWAFTFTKTLAHNENGFSPEVSTQNGLSALPGRHGMLFQSGHKYQTDANSSSFHYKPFSSSFRHSIRTPKQPQNDRVTLKDALNYNLALFPRNRIEWHYQTLLPPAHIFLDKRAADWEHPSVLAKVMVKWTRMKSTTFLKIAWNTQPSKGDARRNMMPPNEQSNLPSICTTFEQKEIARSLSWH